MKEGKPADIEFRIHRYDERSYTVDFCFTDSDSQIQADICLGAEDQAFASFDFEELTRRQNLLDMKGYGQLLTECFFADSRLKMAYAQARARAALLRVRLVIHPSAIELHHLRWETLNDPQTGLALATDQTVFLSRYLSSLDWRQVRLRSKGELRVLAAVADPAGLEKDGLMPIDRPHELEVIRKGTGSIPPDVLECTSLNQIAAAMTGQIYDVLYLVAHGKFNRRTNEPTLWLDNGQGQAIRVPGSELVTRIRELEHRPLLVILVSCQSAAAGEGDALAALGPALAEAGIPAVLAMQGNVTVETVTQLIPELFTQLGKDGRIDRALNIARGQVREQADWWMPVLFMRIKNGRLWTEEKPGTETPQAERDHPDLLEKQPRQEQLMDPVAFYPLLSGDAFSMEDLEELCFTLGVDWELLRGQTKPAKARAMIQYFNSRGRLKELVEAALKARPNLKQ